MAVNKNTRKDSLTIFRNNMMLEQAILEVNVRMAEREKFASTDLNSNLSVHIKGLKGKVAQIQKNIDVIDKMLAEEEDKKN